MFGGKNKPTQVKASGNKTTLIAAGAQVSGDISFSGNLEVEGVVIGSVVSTDEKSMMRVVNKGRLEGELRVPRALIDGEIKGDVHVTEYLELSENAHIQGDVYYSQLETAKGARINGRLLFTPDKKQASTPVELVKKQENK